MYFYTLMKKKQIVLFKVVLVVFCSHMAVGQTAKNQINAPQKLTEILNKKIELDRENEAKKLFTIQVFYGAHEPTLEALEKFEELFPEIGAQLIFETPNYKIRAGQFATEREAQEILVQIKRRFRAAFVLKP